MHVHVLNMNMTHVLSAVQIVGAVDKAGLTVPEDRALCSSLAQMSLTLAGFATLKFTLGFPSWVCNKTKGSVILQSP